MPITTTITSAAAPYANVAPIPFTITFSDTVSGFELSDLLVTGGSALRLEGSGAVYTAYVNPLSQGSVVSIQVLAGVAMGSEPNLESNSITSEFTSIKPRATIEHDLAPITNAQNLPISIIFDREVTGFTAEDFSLANASLYSLSGSGANYQAVLVPITMGKIEFWVNEGAGYDLFGNPSAKSNEVALMFDPTSFDAKADMLNYEIEDPNILIDFELPELAQVAQIQSLADCAKNIPQRLLEKAQEKAFELISQNENIKKLTNTVAIVQQKIETISAIVEQVQTFVEKPETLLKAVLEAKGLTGDALRAKVQGIADKFGQVSGLDKIMSTIDSLDICGQQDFYADGSAAPSPTLTPTDIIPPPVLGVETSVLNNTYDSQPKDAYDQFAFQLKDTLELDSSQEQDPDRNQMISILTTLAMGYHDGISKTIDNSRDDELFAKFTGNVESEKAKNVGWAQPIKDSFATRTQNAGATIQRSTDVIRAFYNRNAPPSGAPLSIGITTYSGPDKDFTTFLDIKPSERPPELTAKYKAEGKRIPEGNTYTNSNGKTFKIGTLSYADAYRGAYGPIVSDKTVASTRVPGGSIIALRNPDGTVYDPTGRNPSGQYTVMDTGNAELTYKKPDVFTSNPELYKNMNTVHVYLVSKGNKSGPQYNLAQRKFGNSGVV